MRIANIPWSLPLENKSVLLKGQSTDSWRTFRAFTEQTELAAGKQTSLGARSLSALRVSDLKRHEAVLPGRSPFCWRSTSDVFPYSAADLAVEVAHSCAKNWNIARLLWTTVEHNILTLGLKWSYQLSSWIQYSKVPSGCRNIPLYQGGLPVSRFITSCSAFSAMCISFLFVLLLLF